MLLSFLLSWLYKPSTVQTAPKCSFSETATSSHQHQYLHIKMVAHKTEKSIASDIPNKSLQSSEVRMRDGSVNKVSSMQA